MSIIELDVNSFKQNFNIDKEIRYKYGEINTPFFLVNKILDLIDSYEFENPNKKWLDIGTGSGYFSIILYKRLFKGLEKKIKDPQDRSKHIIKNMIYMTEIRKENCDLLQELFGSECNLFKGDFLSLNLSENFDNIEFDFVIGNPPYNNNGLKKVPSNNISSKKEDGTTVWIPFIKKSVDLLKTNSGQLVVIIPSLWLKPDKAKMYHFMMNYKLEYLNCMTNTETNQIFNKYAQTPTCYFKLTKTKNPGFVTVFDKDIDEYVKWNLRENKPIPLFGYSVLKKINKKLTDENKLLITKTNLPSKQSIFSSEKTDVFSYPCISTCVLNKLKPELVIEYCNRQENFYGIPKLIMAHKMYGFPYIDNEGAYGISNRDNYIIYNKSLQDLERLKSFFSTKIALYIFEATRYRMKYLEKYIFELIPDITKLNDFPEIITDETISKYFNFTETDIKNINKLHKKQYERF
jgi:tRNA1(Val) A37 N6-methylase TrmN6